MKAVPLLAITNAVTLALVILLYFQDDAPQARRSASSGSGQVNEAEIEDRIFARLNSRAANRADAADIATDVNAPAKVGGDETAPANAGGAAPADAGTDSATPTLTGPAMDTFRKNVRSAQELNREEDRVNREVERLDRLLAANKIGAMNTKQKKKVAATLLNARDKMPNVWRQFRSNPAMRELPREERAKLVRVEYQKLRDDTQTELEKLIPAADAKTILDESLRTGGDRGFGTPRTSRRSVR